MTGGYEAGYEYDPEMLRWAEDAVAAEYRDMNDTYLFMGNIINNPGNPYPVEFPTKNVSDYEKAVGAYFKTTMEAIGSRLQLQAIEVCRQYAHKWTMRVADVADLMIALNEYHTQQAELARSPIFEDQQPDHDAAPDVRAVTVNPDASPAAVAATRETVVVQSVSNPPPAAGVGTIAVLDEVVQVPVSSGGEVVVAKPELSDRAAIEDDVRAVLEVLADKAGKDREEVRELINAAGAIADEMPLREAHRLRQVLGQLAASLGVVKVVMAPELPPIDRAFNSKDARNLRVESGRGGIQTVGPDKLYNPDMLDTEDLPRYAIAIWKIPDFRARRAKTSIGNEAFDFNTEIVPAVAAQILRAVMLRDRDTEDPATAEMVELINGLSDFQVSEAAVLVMCMHRIMQHAGNYGPTKLATTYQQGLLYLAAKSDEAIAQELARMAGKEQAGKWTTNIARTRGGMIDRLTNIRPIIEDILTRMAQNPDLHVLERSGNRSEFEFTTIALAWLRTVADMPFDEKRSKIPYVGAKLSRTSGATLQPNFKLLLRDYERAFVEGVKAGIDGEMRIVLGHLAGQSHSRIMEATGCKPDELSTALLRFNKFLAEPPSLTATRIIANVAGLNEDEADEFGEALSNFEPTAAQPIPAELAQKVWAALPDLEQHSGATADWERELLRDLFERRLSIASVVGRLIQQGRITQPVTFAGIEPSRYLALQFDRLLTNVLQKMPKLKKPKRLS